MAVRRKRSVRPAWRVFKPTSWDKFLEAIGKARESLNFERYEECFFRGHAHPAWELLPTLFRYSKAARLDQIEVRELEGALFWEFQARAQDLHNQDLSDWDYLFYMRHHGMITRVLDWTEGLGVAIYFALEKYRDGGSQPDSAPCIWLLNPYSLNANRDAWDARDLISPRYLGYIPREDETYDYGELVDADKFHWTLPVAIYPIQRSSRVRAQRGWFTIHGTDHRALEVQAPGSVAQVYLPESAIEDAKNFLNNAGLNEYTVYADLDALAIELHRKNGVDLANPSRT